jgi:ADP-ribose pyrophosphatase YjhB (NUDIX family)
MIIYGSSVIITKNNEILLIKRANKPFKGYWGLPGGGKEDNETFEECAKREVMEEVGLCLCNLIFFGCIRIKNKYGLQFSQFFSAKPVFMPLKIQPEEVLKAQFFPIHSLPIHIVPWQKEIIGDYITSM